MTESARPTPSQLRDDAALEWVSRLASGGRNAHLDDGVLSAQELIQLQAWLDADELNARAYYEARQLWMLTALPAIKVAKADYSTLQQYMTTGRRRRRSSRTYGLIATAASLVCAALVVMLVARPETWLEDLRADYVSRPNQLETVALEDGSEVLLDGDSAITVSLREGEREVKLLRGAAYFQVEHDGRPFSVDVGNGRVSVLGTQFEVREMAQGYQIAVRHGRVAVSDLAEGEVLLTDSQGADLSSSGVSPARAINSRQQFNWQNGRLSFQNTPLADAVEIIQRHSASRIVVLGKALTERPVSGDFSSADPEAILLALQSVMGFRIQVLPGGTTVIH